MSVFISLIVIIPVTRILSKEGVGILDYLSKTLIIFEPIGKNLQIKSASLAIKNSFRVRIVLLRNVFIVCCIIYFIMIGVGHKQKPGVSFLPIDQQFVPLYFLDKLIIDSRCQHYMDLYDKNLSIKWCQEVLVNLEPTIILRGSKMIELETPVSHEVYSSSKLRRLFIKNMISIIDYWQNLYYQRVSFIDFKLRLCKSFGFCEYHEIMHYYYDKKRNKLAFGLSDSLVDYLNDQYPNHDIFLKLEYFDVDYNTTDDSKPKREIGFWITGF